MVEAYNYFVGGYLPKVSAKTNVHNKKELKNKYKNIVSLNNANPLAMIKLSSETQVYALDVKELSMEMGEAAQNTLDSEPDTASDCAKSTIHLFNELLQKSDEYGMLKHQPSRPGCELRVLVSEFGDELQASGISVDDDSFLSLSDETGSQIPVNFMEHLRDKCEYMSMNPMEYVDKKIYSYSHLHRNDIGSAYAPSVYTGMLFNSYC